MWVEELKTLIKARYPAIWLVTQEEERVTEIIKNSFFFKAETGDMREIYEWSAISGIQKITAQGREDISAAQDVFSALEEIKSIAEGGEKQLFILKDPHDFLKDPLSIRQFKEAYFTLKTTFGSIIVVSPILQIPTELEKMITVIDVPLPTFDELKEKLLEIVNEVNEAHGLAIKLDNGKLEEIVKAGLGLTMSEFEHTVAKSIVKHRDVIPEEIVKEKEQIIRKTGVLEYYHSVETLKDVGGLENLKEWLIKRKAAFTEKARKFGLKPPKGILLAGAPGTGKSLTAKVTANIFGFPLLRMDVASIFGQYVGESERNMRAALKIAESVSPSLLWLDEVERIVAGYQSSSTDSGVTSRVIGQLLTWMQERSDDKPVFVIMTTNDPLALPPQLIRAGRLDEIFHVDLPNEKERREIFKIHLKKVGWLAESFDLDALAKATEGFVGSEIEQVIQDALYEAFTNNSNLSNKLILKCIKETTPLSKKRTDEIERMRKWAEQNAKPANKPYTVEKKKVRVEL